MLLIRGGQWSTWARGDRRTQEHWNLIKDHPDPTFPSDNDFKKPDLHNRSEVSFLLEPSEGEDWTWYPGHVSHFVVVIEPFLRLVD